MTPAGEGAVQPWLPAGEQLLAHHPLVFAIPALVPAVVVVAVVLYIARNDRRAEAEENEAMRRALAPEEDEE